MADNFTYNPKDNTTSQWITKYEKCAVIGIRTQQLSNGANTTLLDSEKKDIKTMRDIAELEYSLKKLPFIIKRRMPNNTYEYWKLEDLHDFMDVIE